MPIYHHFYVECRRADGWVLPPDFVPDSTSFQCGHRFGEFTWAHPRRSWLVLFLGTAALFPMRPGPPDDRRGSGLIQHLDQFYDYALDEDQLCWLPYSDLLIDCWDTEVVTVGTRVPARHALLFGDGQQVFPSEGLLRAGVLEAETDHLREGWLAEEPVDAAFGRQRFRINELPPDHPVEVTWHATITEFIGEPQAGLFKGLRQYGRDEDRRILSKRG